MPIKTVLTLPLLVCVLGCGASAEQTTCGPASAVVERVIDGDTVQLDDGSRTRLLWIDAPELDHCFGAEAERQLAYLAEAARVELGYGPRCRDGYGRRLARLNRNGEDLGRRLLERGYACVSAVPPLDDAILADYRERESLARLEHRGLWGRCQEVPCAP